MKRFLATLGLICPAIFVQAQDLQPAHLVIFGKLPDVFASADNELTQEKIDLGRMLFYEHRLSKNQQISCNSCHALDAFGVDGKRFSDGHAGQLTGRNSPTVYNAAGHIAQFWDGRAPTVEEQAKGPVLAGGEMAMPSADHVVTVLKSIPGYVEKFKTAFPGEDDPVTYDNMAKAIGAFERKLVTPCRFDDVLAGKTEAFNEQEQRGLAKFVSTGCTTCHMGPAVGGFVYQKLGLAKAWPGLSDPGRSDITKNDVEKGFFKVPGLRNIEKTGPYLHDGSVNSLPLMVHLMAEHQLGKTLPAQDVDDIVAFLNALTGKVDADYIKKPELPASGPDTPKPVLD